MMCSELAIGWVGLGAMGTQMAKNLLKGMAAADPARTLVVHNRDSSKCSHLVELGASQASDLASLFQECQIIFFMLANDAAVKSVIDGLLLAAPGHEVEGAVRRILVDCSTVSPDTSRWAQERCEAAGVGFASSPCWGRPDAAAAAKLLFATAGPSEYVEQLLSLLSMMGRKVMRVGEDPSKAAILKLAGNFSIVGIIEMLGEAMSMCEASGLSREQFLTFVEEFYPAPPIVGYATRIARDEIGVGSGFTVELALKDVGHMRSLGRDGSCPLPLADLAYNNLLTAKANGYGAADWGALTLATRMLAGLPLPPVPALKK